MAVLPIDALLNEFKPDDYTVKMLQAIFKVVPYSPALPQYRVMEDVVRTLDSTPNPIAFAKCRIEAAGQDIQDVLWMGNLLDTGDKGYALFTGLKSAVNLVRGQGSAALETDDQQRNDAVIKGLGIAYMAYNAFPGSVAERVEAFRNTPAGQALLMYYAAVEVALPFADNAAVSGANMVDRLFQGAPAQFQKLAGMAGGKSLDGAMETLKSMSQPIQKVVDVAVQYTKPVAQTAQQYLPGAMGGADKVAGVVANAADVMPVYRYLSIRLAAEGAAYRALKS